MRVSRYRKALSEEMVIRIYQCRKSFAEPEEDLSLEVVCVCELERDSRSQICDEEIVCESSDEGIYPYKDAFNSVYDNQFYSGKFFRAFEPIAKDAYLKLTNFSNVDFDELEIELSRCA